MKKSTLLKYHSWFGLISGIFIVLLGISGSILVFQHDIEDALWEEYIKVEATGERSIDKGLQTIQENYDNWNLRLINFEEGEALVFNLRRPTERLFVFVHPTSGEIIKVLNELTTISRWLLKFHYSFQAGIFGRVLVFVIGVLFLLSLLTGIYLHRRSIIDVLLLREKIIFSNKRALHSSLHRVVGVWSLLLNLLLVVTGTFLAYAVMMAAFAGQKIPQPPVVDAPMEKILSEIESDYTDFTPTYMSFPRSDAGTVSIYGKFDDDPFYYSEYYNSISANYSTGEITGVTRIQEADFATKFSSTLLPLHFGNFGGIWTKLLYCIVGLSGPLLSITGFYIWWNARKLEKKRKKRQNKVKIKKVSSSV